MIRRVRRPGELPAQWALVALLVGSVACERAKPTPGRAAPPAGSDASAPTATKDASSASPDAAASSAPGMKDGQLPSPAAVKENDAAVALLAKGKADLAIGGFAKALEASPMFLMARYNLACARARAADMEGAERELTSVFEADWVGLRAHAAQDEDLRAFRASTPGARLFGRAAELDARFQASIDRGVHAMLWSARSKDVVVPEALRVGVWDAATSRFVATSERRRGALSAYVSAELPYAVILTGSIPAAPGDLSDRVIVKDVSYWPYGVTGVAHAIARVERGAGLGSLDADGDQVTLLTHSAVGYGDDKHPDLFQARFRFSPASGISKTELATKLPEPKPDPKIAHGSLQLPFHNGFETWTASAGYAWNGRVLTLPDGKSVAVPRDVAFASKEAPDSQKPSITASPKGDRVVLVWDSHSCGDACGGGIVTVGAHHVVIVRPETGRSKKIAAGTGIGAARFDPSGRLFVQRDRRTFEAVDPEDLGTWKELPEGVLLVAPVVREDAVQCCGF